MTKTHPHGLPHLNEAKLPDGTVDHDKVLAGADAWSKAIATGQYSLTNVHEFALDEQNDVLIIHRQKN